MLGDVEKIILFLFTVMGCAAYIGTTVIMMENRKETVAIRALLEQRLEVYSTNSPTISVDIERRVERLEAGILILHKSVQALEAGQKLEGYKLDEILAALQSNHTALQPTISAIPAVVPRDLGHGTGYSLERQSLQLQAAVAWLKSNDRELKLTTREAERLSGIPRNTINRAQHWIRNE